MKTFFISFAASLSDDLVAWRQEVTKVKTGSNKTKSS